LWKRARTLGGIMGAPGVQGEIESAIAAHLGRLGIEGATVLLRGTHAEMHGAGAVVAIELGDWVAQWQLLPPDMRERRAEAAALRLVAAARGVSGGAAASGAVLGAGAVGRIAGVVAGVLVFVVVGVWLYRSGFFGVGAGGAALSSSAATSADADAHRRRVERACEAARQRLYAGASMAMDLEGWVVELLLAGGSGAEHLAEDPAVKALERGAAAPEIGVEGPSEVKIAPQPVDALGVGGVLVRYSGGYVTVFFHAEGRPRFLSLATRLAQESGATAAALWARCAHLGSNDVGAWYWGRDDAWAAGALLYAAGLHAAPPVIQRARVAAGPGPLAVLVERARAIGPDALDEAIGKVGGRIERRRVETDPKADAKVDAGAEAARDGATTLSFALGGPTRATQASRALVDKLGL
jgi:hypothetical protein